MVNCTQCSVSIDLDFGDEYEIEGEIVCENCWEEEYGI